MVDKFQIWLVADRKPAILFVVAGLIGGAFALYLLGWGGIEGTSNYWTTNHNDSVQSIAGLRYFLAEDWGWPVLHIESYGYPQGTNLVLTDSIPLLAVFAKLFRSILPDGFHYFGYWLAFSFVMQAMAMVALMVVLGWRSYSATLVASGLALLQTALLTRFFHAALMGQFLIILTIVAGVWVIKENQAAKGVRWFWALIAVSFFVHPYIYAMVTVLAVAFVAELVYRQRLELRSSLEWVLAVAIGSVALVVLSGVGSEFGSVATGFVTYSMNLLALVLKEPDATGGQYEGFSYLGLGVIGLIALNLYASRSLARRLLQDHWIPVVAVVLMTLYALSARVWIGDVQLLWLPVFGPVEWLSERFRSTGRFVWPLVYVLVATAMILTVRRFNPRVALALLLGALFIQSVDMAATTEATRNVLRESEGQVLEASSWPALIADHTLIRMTPHGCVIGSGAPAFASREVQRIAGRLNVAITTSATARSDAGCDDPSFNQPLAPGELRVVWRAHKDPYRLANNQEACLDFSLGTVCTLDQENLTGLRTLGW